MSQGHVFWAAWGAVYGTWLPACPAQAQKRVSYSLGEAPPRVRQPGSRLEVPVEGGPGPSAGSPRGGECQALRVADEQRDELRISEFGFPGKLRDRLVAAILSGEKTATTGLLIEWELDSEQVPRAGERMLVVDSSQVPVAIIELVRLADVDIATAKAEGEGYRSVEEWRLAHEAFWDSYADDLRSRLADPSWRLVDDTPVVVEYFRLVDVLTT